MIIDFRLIIPIVVSFLITFFITPFWIRKAKDIGLVWKDMNKYSDKRVAGSGGIMVLVGFLIGVLIFVGYRIFIINNSEHLIQILSLLLVVLMASGIGFVDDLLGWQKGGLSRRSRILLVAISAIPLMVINAGVQQISLFGVELNIGIIYALILIPIGIVGATTTFNFLAGFNGLEAGLGIITIAGLSIVSFFTGNSWLTVIGLCMCASLIGFLVYNKFPAKIFPGDVMTYGIGSIIGVMAILGNFEKITVFFFIPYIIEVILKSRGKLLKYSFGKPNADGSLSLQHSKLYGLTHVSIYLLNKIGIKSNEKNVVYFIWAFQALVIIIAFLIFREGIFG